MKIATWNVNSIRSRKERVLHWLDVQRPDILCLQELKGKEETFPAEEFREKGYFAAVYGQPTYNGVAILSRQQPQDVQRSFGDGTDDPQARCIAARFDGILVVSVYVPNGATVGSEKWRYKLDWLARLRAFLDGSCDPRKPLALCGDFNIAPDDADVANPDIWRNSVLCHEEGRRALKDVCDWGLVDTFRRLHPEGGVYSWWDYRRLGFPRNDGLRLDHILVTEPLAKRLEVAEIDRNERKGTLPSDHAPALASFRRL